MQGNKNHPSGQDGPDSVEGAGVLTHALPHLLLWDARLPAAAPAAGVQVALPGAAPDGFFPVALVCPCCCKCYVMSCVPISPSL